MDILHEKIGCLDTLPRACLLAGATPLEKLANLSRRLDCGPLWVKRDDLTGLAFGGNKVRQLEFYVGDARAKGADTVLITGAVQSNFVRLAAAAARKFALDCHIQLEDRVAKNDPAYKHSGNVLIDRMLGATIHAYPEGEDEEGADARLAELADELARAGRNPYIIHLAPGHPPLGALGYVDAARELLSQCATQDLAFDEIIVASGSGHTHAGILFGLRALGCPVRVTGVCVRRGAEQQFARIASRCLEIAGLLDMEPVVTNEDIHVTDAYLAPGYGRMSEPVLKAMQMAAETEALMTDPVYTAKTFCGLLDRVKASSPDAALLMLHTGGTPAIFAYERELTAAISR